MTADNLSLGSLFCDVFILKQTRDVLIYWLALKTMFFVRNCYYCFAYIALHCQKDNGGSMFSDNILITS